jgi:PadR family transcriptional regulator PadR
MYYKVVHMKTAPTLGEFEQTVLLAILRLPNEAYGVSIREEILTCTRRAISPGALYTTLDRLEQKGLVVTKEGSATAERGGRAKRFYRLTRAGQKQLVESQRSFQRLLAGLNLLGENQ